MNYNRILILKNDRAGDLFASFKLIANLLNSKSKVTIYLSEYNYDFSFLFSGVKLKKTNFNLTIMNKISIFINILINKYDSVYILSPKNFFFFLPYFFRKTKFYAIVYDGKKRLRPPNFLRKFLYKYRVIYRNKININNYCNLQLELIDKKTEFLFDYSSIKLPSINNQFKKLLPKNYVFFQFKYNFFAKLGWSKANIVDFFDLILRKYEFILFCSDKEINQNTKNYVDFFEKEFSCIDVSKFQFNQIKKKKIIYLKNLDSVNFFHIISLSKLNIGSHGILTHLSDFCNIPSYNLFNFDIENINDYHHQKISFSEWYSNMNLKFSFLNSDFKKSLNKINRNI